MRPIIQHRILFIKIKNKEGIMPDRYHFRNFVFEGGGVKGIAYVGAIAELEKRGILKDIKRVEGTSAGAINAVLVGLNYSTAEMDDILRKLNFNNFLDD